MYKVQNIMPGNLPVDLEKGSIILTSGQMFDLDTCCSRKWIYTNILLKKLFASKALRLVHDSEVKLPKAPIKKVTSIKTAPAAPSPLPKPVAKIPSKPKIKDLSDKEDLTEKKYKKPKAKTKKKKEDDPIEKLLTEKKTSKKEDKKSKRSYTRSYSWRRTKEKDEDEES